MYNPDFYSQLQAFRDDLWGPECVDTMATSDQTHRMYSFPPKIQIYPCKQNDAGEWVPVPEYSRLENSMNSK